MPRIKYTKGSDNVFADLGVPNSEEYLAKADLAREIINIVQQRGLTQNEAAAILNVDQAKVSALNRGRLDGFSMERLTRFLRLLGKRVEIVIRPIIAARPRLAVSGAGEQAPSDEFSSYICTHLQTSAVSPELEDLLPLPEGPFTEISIETVHGVSSDDWRSAFLPPQSIP